ncbi:A/G-specific adenine glycosylase [Spirochaeta isovalerica]|uniref:Adenine DNA glycosylase n=1 Tax=Spirochaeta isovalerica TaxID=150 RepID=A0A841RCI4_9SPIO|nr:A/G-specific adenine glycosylase [Spirochaeta isovalerica]MBB6480700.1 A/G-specific adenine glycosylase [Spirochaeta isovalerica]
MTTELNAAALLEWFDREKRDFPWSREKTPYRVWISEIMLQQTVASTVIPYFEKWCRDYPGISDLSETPIEEAMSRWEGLGYYSRCRNIHKAAGYLMEKCNGVLPSDYEGLRLVPGIGDYTARAILSIAYGKPYPVLDANVRRILQRLEGRKDWKKADDGRVLKELEKIIPVNRPGDFNEAMMQLGQQICSTGSPLCGQCPLSANCRALEQGITAEIPAKKVKKIKMSEKTVLLFHSEGKILMRKKKKGLFHDLWLLPTVEEDSCERMKRINSEWSFLNTQLLTQRNHFYTDNKDTLSPCLITSEEIDLSHMTPGDDDTYEHKWIEVSELDKYPCPSVYRKILDEVIEYLQP